MFHRLYLWLAAAGVQSMTGTVRDQGDRDRAAVQLWCLQGTKQEPPGQPWVILGVGWVG